MLKTLINYTVGNMIDLYEPAVRLCEFFNDPNPEERVSSAYTLIQNQHLKIVQHDQDVELERYHLLAMSGDDKFNIVAPLCSQDKYLTCGTEYGFIVVTLNNDDPYDCVITLHCCVFNERCESLKKVFSKYSQLKLKNEEVLDTDKLFKNINKPQEK